MSYHYRPRFKVTGLELVESTQQNPHYDPAKSCNGGGYDQPYMKFQSPAGTLEFNDTSCGDFGTSYDVKYTTPQEKTYSFSYDNMNHDEEGLPIIEGGIPRNHEGIIRFCSQMGYKVQELPREKTQTSSLKKVHVRKPVRKKQVLER